jgi:YidC/Oxa1 family membrane protein insertase
MSPYALLDPLVHAFSTALTGIAGLLPGPTGGPALLAAIAVLTLALRAALLPAAVSTYRATRARAALAPEIGRLRARYGKDRVRLAEEINAVYRKAGVRPLAGVGPMVVQGLAVAALYRSMVAPVVAGHANALLDATVLGAPLTGHWTAFLAAGAVPTAAVAILLAGLVAVAWGASRLAARQSPDAGRLVRAVPYATPVFALLAPAAVGVYLLTSTAWTLAERVLLPQLVR